MLYAYKNIDIGTFPLCNKFLIQHFKLPGDDSKFRLQCSHVVDPETPMVLEEHGFTCRMFSLLKNMTMTNDSEVVVP